MIFPITPYVPMSAHSGGCDGPMTWYGALGMLLFLITAGWMFLTVMEWAVMNDDLTLVQVLRNQAKFFKRLMHRIV